MPATIVQLPIASGAPLAAVASPAPLPEPPMPYGDEFERKLTSLILRDDLFAREAVTFIRPSHFTDSLNRNLVKVILEFTAKYGVAPSPETIMGIIVSDARFQKVEYPYYSRRILELVSVDIRERQYIREKVVLFCQAQEMLRLAADIPDLLGKATGPEIGKIKERMAQAASIGDVQGAKFYDYFERAKEREEFRDAKSRGIIKRGVSTGISELDDLLYHGGWGRGELSVPMAPAKRGKTAFALQTAIMSCLTTGSHWLMISCEVGLEIMGDRLDACCTSTEMSSLISDRARVATAVAAAGRGPGKLWLERYPSATLTTDGIDALIQYYLDSGKKLDAVVVDYIGILRLKVPDDRFVGLGIAAKELRRIAGKYDLAMVAPAQTNRDAVGKSTAGMEHIGESFSIAQDCDLLLSINATDQEMAHGVRRIAVAASRNQAEFWVKVQGDLGKMKMIESVLEVHN